MLAKMVLWNTEIVGDSRVMQMRKKKKLSFRKRVYVYKERAK